MGEKNRPVRATSVTTWSAARRAGGQEGQYLTVRLANAKKQEMEVEFVVEDHNVAFRYFLPKQGGTGSVRVMNETTGFRFPGKTTTFLTPQSDAMIGWKRTKPSYEEEYKADAPMDTPSQYGHGYTFPGLFHVGKTVGCS